MTHLRSVVTLCLCFVSLDCPADSRTWVPFQGRCYHFVHGEEDSIKSYTFERARTLCRGFGTSSVTRSRCCSYFLTRAFLHLPELLSVQSAEENEFVLAYSPQVWKGAVNVWLGMYYDTNSK